MRCLTSGKSTMSLCSMRTDTTLASMRLTNQCFAYLLDATKHVDPGAMAALLQQLGLSLSLEVAAASYWYLQNFS